MKYHHESVLLDEVMTYLNPKPGQKFIDCTLGGGGYTFALADKVGEKGLVLAIDADEIAIKNAEKIRKERKIKNIKIHHDNFRNLSQIYKEEFKQENIFFDGIVFDLGLSTAQLEDRHRGFSFQLDAPLNMAFGQVEKYFDTEFIVNKYTREELARVIRDYSEEKHAWRIAGAIVDARRIAPVKTTKDLVEIIRNSVPKSYLNGKINPATRTFQALRMETNQELESLKQVLPVANGLLKTGGRLALVSFHSLEDRIVKHYFKDESIGCVCPNEFPVCRCEHTASLRIITKKPVLARDEEIKNNPRSRSAKLRVAEKIV